MATVKTKDHRPHTGAQQEGAYRATITDSHIDTVALEDWARTDECGAVVSFLGVVRDHDHGRGVISLSYTGHPQCQRFLETLVASVTAAHGVRIAAVHRLGALDIGDTALAVSVASGHRKEAFALCALIVDRIKAEVPIWKLQHFDDDTSEWVSACGPEPSQI